MKEDKKKIKMERKLKITRILALVAFAIYTGSLFLPYVKFELDHFFPTTYSALRTLGMDLGMYMYCVFIIPILIFCFVKHSLLMKWLTFSFVVLLLFFSFSLTIQLSFDAKLLIGVYMFLLSNLLFLTASIIKFVIPVPKKHSNNNVNVLDDFLTQSSELKNE